MKKIKTDINYIETFFFLLKPLLRLILGMTFVFAAYHKIYDPAGFAKIIYGYAIFPKFAINILAIIVPFIELIVGFSLIFGLFPRAALIIIIALLFLFSIIIGFNLLRGHEFNCGCFGFEDKSDMSSVLFLLFRDICLLSAGIYLLVTNKKKI